MIRTTDQLLAYEFRTKPWLKAIYDDLDQMTLEQVQAVPFPMKWVRDIFEKRKRDQIRVVEDQAYKAALDMASDAITTPIVMIPDRQGQLIRWTGIEVTFFKIDGGGSIGVNEGHYLFMPADGGIYLDTLFSRFIDPQVYQHGVPSGSMSLSEYKTFVTEERNRRVPADAPVIDFAQQEMMYTGRDSLGVLGRLGGMGVRFS